MTITLYNHEFNFDLTGTVGLVYLCQKMMGEEPDFSRAYDQAVLYYCALTTSNPEDQHLPDLMQFIASLTTPLLTEMSTFFWKRWHELEGTAPKNDEDEEKGEDSALANSTKS